jgi:hypothetical protein
VGQAKTTYFDHFPSADVEEMDGHIGLAASICPRADLCLLPRHESFLGALREVCASAVLQCSGSTKYRDTAARNRARIAADYRAERGLLGELNRRANRKNRMVA